MKRFSSLAEIDHELEAYYPSHMQRTAYTLEFVTQFLQQLGNPQDIPKSIHIAGTSGKTSTAYYAAALLKQAGKRVGLLISPHLEHLTERVQIDLEPLPEKEFCDEMSVFMELVVKSGLQLTFAEILYAFGYWEFVRQRVEYIVVEVGMGGLLDATNVITRPDKVCVITDIGFDHTNVLGNTLEEITRHKAGIIHPENTVFCHQQPAVVLDGIRDACRVQGADLHIIDESPMPSHLPLFQKRNLSLALEAVTYALSRDGKYLREEQIAAAAQTRIPGRMETLQVGEKTLIIDTAHNPQKLRALCQSLEEAYPNEPVAVLAAFADGRGRKIEEQLIELAPVTHHMIITALPASPIHIGRDPQSVAEACKRSCINSYEVSYQPRDAYNKLLARPERILVITGSNYLLEALLPLIRRTKRQQKVTTAAE